MLPPLRLLLVLDNLQGRRTPAFVPRPGIGWIRLFTNVHPRPLNSSSLSVCGPGSALPPRHRRAIQASLLAAADTAVGALPAFAQPPADNPHVAVRTRGDAGKITVGGPARGCETNPSARYDSIVTIRANLSSSVDHASAVERFMERARVQRTEPAERGEPPIRADTPCYCTLVSSDWGRVLDSRVK